MEYMASIPELLRHSMIFLLSTYSMYNERYTPGCVKKKCVFPHVHDYFLPSNFTSERTAYIIYLDITSPKPVRFGSFISPATSYSTPNEACTLQDYINELIN